MKERSAMTRSFRLLAHSGLMFAALLIRHHRSISAL
jgi:hypothetical protein